MKKKKRELKKYCKKLLYEEIDMQSKICELSLENQKLKEELTKLKAEIEKKS